jgi:hypothetical protein
MTSRQKTVLGIALPILLGMLLGLAYLIPRANVSPVSVVHGHIAVDEKLLDADYQKMGTDAFIAYVKDMSAHYSRANYHFMGHALGNILYTRDGLDAVALCGDSFEWGCLHEVIGQAYAEDGATTTQKLIATCASYTDPKKRGECQHGLGHGIMYVNNYATGKLDQMFQECDTITTVRPIPKNASCHAGLMMEYNMHLMTMEYNGENGRPADSDHPFDFCNVLSKEAYKEMCVYWAVPWLHGRLYDFAYDADTFKKLGELCNENSDPNLRATCFKGIGRSIGINAYFSPNIVDSFCTASTKDPALQSVCIRSAAGVYMSVGKSNEAKQICSLAPNSTSSPCFSDQ